MIDVCIVGVGLIGGSLGKALRRVRKNGRRVYSVSGLGRSVQKLHLAHSRGALDRFSIQPSELLPNADIVVLATPVQTMADFIRWNVSSSKRGAVITDVGSVKGKISIEMKKALFRRRDVTFIGAHPLAGSEKAGIKNAKANLFKQAVCVVAKGSGTAKARTAVVSLWKAVGAETIYLSNQSHDKLLAMTSHLPHLIAFGLFEEAVKSSLKGVALKSITAGSFADATRVAASDPRVWSGIFQMNRAQIRKSLAKLTSRMKKILSKNGPALYSDLFHISRAKQTW